jgi:hypothetical protein
LLLFPLNIAHVAFGRDGGGPSLSRGSFSAAEGRVPSGRLQTALCECETPRPKGSLETPGKDLSSDFT